METKTIVIWVLSFLLVGALVYGTILFVQNGKMKKRIADPANAIQDYINTLPIYTNDADAKANGLVTGNRYRTSATATSYSTVQ